LLIGFFLSSGLDGTPGVTEVLIAVIVLVVLPIKTAGFVAVVSRFRFRARTSWHSSISLATYSEFGLIVAVVGVDRNVLDQRWTSAIAVAVALSFTLAAPLNTARYTAYARLSPLLSPLERQPVQLDDALIDPIDAQIIVFGMGRVGAGALDVEFWGRLRLDSRIELVVLAMSDHAANLVAVRRVKEFLPQVRIAATATHTDEIMKLEHEGVDVARNLYGEAGQGLADDAYDLLDIDPPHHPRALTANRRRGATGWLSSAPAPLACRACGTTLQLGFSMRAMAGSIGATIAHRSPTIRAPVRNRCGTTHGRPWWYRTAAPWKLPRPKASWRRLTGPCGSSRRRTRPRSTCRRNR
jgi:hypothetical protein